MLNVYLACLATWGPYNDYSRPAHTVWYNEAAASLISFSVYWTVFLLKVLLFSVVLLSFSDVFSCSTISL